VDITEKQCSDCSATFTIIAGRSTKRCSLCKREATRRAKLRYRSTAKGKQTESAYKKFYNKSEKGKESTQRYLSSPKGKAYLQNVKVYMKDYFTSPEGKAYLKRWYATPKGKAHIKRNTISLKGRASNLRSIAKRRAQLAIESTLTSQEWTDIKSAYNQSCMYCGTMNRLLQQDHFIPISKGGHHVKENIVPACPSCNGRKGNRKAVLTENGYVFTSWQ
jgi:5-methylcytosine-specific restriction endonuclease McrA